MTHKFLCNFVLCTKCLSVEQAAKLASVLLLIPRNINRELEMRLGFFSVFILGALHSVPESLQTVYTNEIGGWVSERLTAVG